MSAYLESHEGPLMLPAYRMIRTYIARVKVAWATKMNMYILAGYQKLTIDCAAI